MASSSSSSHFNPQVLFVELTGELICIDFEQLLLQPESSRLIHNVPVPDPGIAPIRFKMNLLSEKRLVGLKHATLESNVYLLGGEKLRRGAIPTMSYLIDHSDSYLGPSSQVYDLLRKSHSFRVELSCTIPPLNHPKGSPMVAQIEGKIYVLQGQPYLHILDPPGATFEVYHPSRETWEVLDDPPPYKSKQDIFGHFVLGHKLFIIAEREQIYFFDAHTCSWEQGPEVYFSFHHAGRSLPTNGMCVPFFPQLNNDQFQLMLSRDGQEEEVYALVMNSSTGMLLCYQSLREVFFGLHPVTETGQRIHLTMSSHFFFVLPDSQICAIWAGCDQHKRLRLFVSIFSLNLCFKSVMEFLPLDDESSLCPCPPIERQFLEVYIHHKHDCTVTKEEAFPNYVNDAFLL